MDEPAVNMPESDPLARALARPLISRREAIGGGLVMGLFALAGCAGGGRMSRLPDPSFGGSAGHSVAPYVPAPLPPLAARSAPGNTGGGAPQVMPRSAWTRAGVARMSNINPMNGVSKITVHHDGMTAFTETSTGGVASRIESVRTSHVGRKARDGSRWADIGYHYIICPAGRVWEARSTRYQGAHVQDQNEHNLGIMMLGNFDRQRPTPAAVAALDGFVASQMHRFGVPRSRVYTHRELAPTACPGSALQQYMVQTRGRGGRLAMAAAAMHLG